MGIMLAPLVRDTPIHHFCIKQYYKLLDYILQFNTTIENYKAIYYTYLTWHGINSGQCYQRLSRLYKDIWVPIIGEILFCEREPGNEDCFAEAGHQLLGTFNWKIWLVRQTLKQIAIKGAK